jgi:hypothetical protein
MRPHFRTDTGAARRCVALATVFAALSARAAAQDTSVVDRPAEAGPGRYRVAAVTGYQAFDKSAALRGAPFFGMRVSGLALPMLAVGVSGAFARPTTRGDYFPWNRQPYFSDQAHRNDTTLIFEVSQRVVMSTYGVDVALHVDGARLGGAAPLRRLMLDVGAGAGGYTFWLDPEQVRANRTFSGPQFNAGAGLGIAAGRSAAVGVRVDDVILTRFDRERFSLSDPLLRVDLFPNPEPPPPQPKSTVHNVRFSVLFSYVPGAR